MKARITATKTPTARIVRAEFEDGSTQEWTFGLVQAKSGAWELPNPAIVDQEVRALLGVEAGKATPAEIPDTDVSVRLASAVEPLPEQPVRVDAERAKLL